MAATAGVCLVEVVVENVVVLAAMVSLAGWLVALCAGRLRIARGRGRGSNIHGCVKSDQSRGEERRRSERGVWYGVGVWCWLRREYGLGVAVL